MSHHEDDELPEQQELDTSCYVCGAPGDVEGTSRFYCLKCYTACIVCGVPSADIEAPGDEELPHFHYCLGCYLDLAKRHAVRVNLLVGMTLGAIGSAAGFLVFG